MTDLFHVDQSTADRWRAHGRFVLFGEGEVMVRTDRVIPGTSLPDTYTNPPAAMIEAAKPCEKHQPVNRGPNWSSTLPRYACPCDDNGQRRHPVTVPCETCIPHRPASTVIDDCPDCGLRSRITVAHAVVEWGPLVVRAFPMLVGEQAVRSGDELWYFPSTPERPLAVDTPGGLQFTDPDVLTLPPDVDPASLVGLWAIGGRIEVAA